MSRAVPENEAPVIPEGFQKLATNPGFALQIGPLYQKREGDDGYVRAFRVEPHHTNGMQNAHGGMLMAFADMAFGHVISVRYQRWWISVRLACDFLHPAPLGAWVEGNSEILCREGDLFHLRGRIWVGDTVILTGNGLFKALKQRE